MGTVHHSQWIAREDFVGHAIQVLNVDRWIVDQRCWFSEVPRRQIEVLALNGNAYINRLEAITHLRDDIVYIQHVEPRVPQCLQDRSRHFILGLVALAVLLQSYLQLLLVSAFCLFECSNVLASAFR